VCGFFFLFCFLGVFGFFFFVFFLGFLEAPTKDRGGVQWQIKSGGCREGREFAQEKGKVVVQGRVRERAGPSMVCFKGNKGNLKERSGRLLDRGPATGS